MDSIRKKMQQIQFDIDTLYEKIAKSEKAGGESKAISDTYDTTIRDTVKKVQKYEATLEEIREKLQASEASMEEAEMVYKDKEEDVNAQSRRVLLMEEESRISVEKLATTVMKLAEMSKEADKIIKGTRYWENIGLNNEMEVEALENNLKNTKKMATDNETKYDNLARSMAMMEEECKRADDKVKLAEDRLLKIEEELAAIGANQKQLEITEEKATKRQEKYQDQLKHLNIKLKQSEARAEYAEMNISKLHHKIDELEDEIIREKLKINAVSGQLDDTFNEMLSKY